MNEQLNGRDMAQYYDGAVAHLGERLRGTQKVAGSIPVSSTIFLVGMGL
tara:strand:- start:1821 stop:1967 length:147 start_codon:yes stop_codon:yes gene_type:complete